MYRTKSCPFPFNNIGYLYNSVSKPCTLSAWSVTVCCSHADRWVDECNYKFVWIAGQRTDVSKASAFVWKPYKGRVETIKYSNWHSAQPDYYHQNEACIHIGADLKWNDERCCSKYCFLCQLTSTR